MTALKLTSIGNSVGRPAWTCEVTIWPSRKLILALNGVSFPASDTDAVIRPLQLAAGDIIEPDFVARAPNIVLETKHAE
jgi:hypothetical protein